MDEYQKMIVKKKIKEIKKYTGEGTQLISLYLPPNVDRSSVTKQLTDEISQSSNIKSQHTRKNVQAALKRITTYLRQIDFKLPKNGLVLFSGDVSENPSKTDVILLDIEPPKELKTKLYWCDSSFHTAPLEEQMTHDEVYGVIAVDKREATIALITGKTYRIIKRSTSAVPGKTRAGGQCLKDCLVQLSDGTITDIEDCKSNSFVNSVYFNKKYVNDSSKINKVWEVNKTKTCKIITKNPRMEIEASEDHVFFVNDGYKIIEKKAKDLIKKDSLIVPEIINIKSKKQMLNVNKIKEKDIKLPKILDSKLSKFVGYFMGVGCIEEDSIFFFEKHNILQDYKKEYDNYFNITSNYKLKENKNNQLNFTSRSLTRLIKDNFIEIKEHFNSRIPKKITRSENDVVASFLKGFFDAKANINKNRKNITISIKNKKMAQEMQLLLLRFSIISSFIERGNKTSRNSNFIISISEKKSLEIFKEKINFSSLEKSKTLDKLIKDKSNTNYDRQMIFSGKHIRKIIEENNCNLKLFPKVSAYFNNKSKISKKRFEESILKKIKNKKVYSELLEIYKNPIVPVQIKEIQKTSKKTKMIDISVVNKNFLANGLVVHNSAARFARLREKAAESFFRRVGERVNAAFVGEEKLKGIIVGGPGHTKHDFIDISGLDHRIKDKILGTVDVGYTDESGIKEILDKGSDILKDLSIVKEKELVNQFFGEVAKNNLATYGFLEVLEAIKLGKVASVLISETIDWTVLKFKCFSCDKIIPKVVKDKDNVLQVEKEMENSCETCGKKTELLEEADFIDFIVDFAKPFGSKIEVVSTETQEGMQFYRAFGGIGAFLRYK